MSTFPSNNFDTVSDTTNDQQTSEKSVKSCYAVIYELQNKQWVVSGEGGWSEVHLCMDTIDSSYRLLAWTVKSQEVLLNCNVTSECAYKEKSVNFHSFNDENSARYGLGFHKSNDGLKQAQNFYAAVVNVIQSFKQKKEVLDENDLSPSPLAVSEKQIQSPPRQITNNVQKFDTNGNKTNDDSNDKSTKNNSYNNNNNSHVTKQLTKPKIPPPNPFQQQSSTNSTYFNSNEFADDSNDDDTINKSNKSDNNKNNISTNDTQKNDKISTKPPPPPSTTIKNNENNSNNNSNTFTKQQSGKLPRLPSNDNNNSNNTNTINNTNSSRNSKINTNKNNKTSDQSGFKIGISKINEENGNEEDNVIHSTNTDLLLVNGNNSKNSPQSPTTNGTDDPRFSPSSAPIRNKSLGNQNESPDYHLQDQQTKSLPTRPLGPLGSLKILPPKPKKLASGDKKIQNPDKVEHKIRVLHDKDTGQYFGLPKEWLEVLNKQFGVAPKLLPCVQLQEYNAKIPRVLVQLKETLTQQDGFQQVGIFRLAPNASDNKAIKANIDSGRFSQNDEKIDSNVYANLIKVWFRDLPDPLLNCVRPEMIEAADSQDDVVKVIYQFPEPNQSIFLWLCDMCVEVANFEKENKMGPQNLAIVIGPNLFNTDTFENPMKAMTYSAKVVEFFKKAIIWRQTKS